MLNEVEVESSFGEDEIENVFQFDSEGEEDNVEVNEYYPDYVLKKVSFKLPFGTSIVYYFHKSGYTNVKMLNCVCKYILNQ